MKGCCLKHGFEFGPDPFKVMMDGTRISIGTFGQPKGTPVKESIAIDGDDDMAKCNVFHLFFVDFKSAIGSFYGPDDLMMDELL
jgi:hypothetical protein